MIKDPYLVLFLWFFIIFMFICLIAWAIEATNDSLKGDDENDKGK